MKQGLAAMVVVLLLVGLRVLGGSAPPAPSGAGAAQKEEQGSKEKSKEGQDAEQAYRHFHGGGKLLGDHLGKAWTPNLVSLSVMLVTLPDPRASRLDWMFDSYLGSVRRAFEREGYVLDRFDLPWERQTEEKKRDLLGEPGALLFRWNEKGERNEKSQKDLWLVYIVGELSTGGIDVSAFDRALVERRDLLGPPTSESFLPLVGPVFSGSVPSLAHALERALHPQGLLDGERVEIISGSATSADDLALRSIGAGAVHFRTTLHTDTVLRCVVKEALERLDVEEDELAILQEGTTAYGQAIRGRDDAPAALCSRRAPSAEPTAPGGPPLLVPFPMSISSLREATERERPAEAPAPSPLSPGRASVDLDLGGEPRPDAPVQLSRLTAPAVDLMFEEITRMLAQRDIRAVLLFATDVRDKLFLARELKKRLPDLQLLTTESNVLYLHSGFNAWLRGMIVISTYSLLLPDPVWNPQTPVSGSEQLLFASEGAEGTFNATLMQIERRIEGKATANHLVDYSPPMNVDQLFPPVWLTVVGADTMLPLAVVHESAETVNPSFPAPAQRKDHERQRGWGFFLSLVLSTLSLVALGRVLTILTRGGRRKLHIADPVLEGRDGRRAIALGLHFEVYQATWYLAFLCLLAPPVALILWVHLDWHSFAPEWLLPFLLGGAASVSCFVAAAWHVRRAWRRRFDAPRFDLLAPSVLRSSCPWVEPLLRSLTIAGGILYCVLVGVLVVSLLCLPPESFSLLAHRSQEFDQGVSPFVPLMLIGGLVVLWCQWHCTRIRSLANREPAEEVSCGPGDPDSPLAGLKVRECLMRVLPRDRAWILLCAIGLAIAWGATRMGKTMESVAATVAWANSFRVLFEGGVLAAMGASLWAAYRLLAIWLAFEKALPDADRIPGLPGRGEDDGGDRKHSFRANLGLWPTSHPGDLVRAAARRWEALQAPEGGEPGRRNEVVAQRNALQQRVPILRNADIDSVPQYWDRTLQAKLGSLWAEVEKASSSDGRVDPRTETARELVVLELQLYVEWVIKHMRSLSWFLLLAILLTTLAIASYPFHPQHLIQTISLLVFFATVIVLVYVIGSMNRNAALSHLSGTTPNELSWDRTLFFNLAIYLVVPLVTLVTSQDAGLREQLFQWLDPLLKFMVTS